MSAAVRLLLLWARKNGRAKKIGQFLHQLVDRAYVYFILLNHVQQSSLGSGLWIFDKGKSGSDVLGIPINWFKSTMDFKDKSNAIVNLEQGRG